MRKNPVELGQAGAEARVVIAAVFRGAMASRSPASQKLVPVDFSRSLLAQGLSWVDAGDS